MNRITSQALDSLSAEAAASSRKRKNLNLHERPDDPVQRLFNALEPGTYVRPHRHGEPSTWEVMYFVRGSAVFLVFDAIGTVLERLVLSSRGPVYGIQMQPDTWHAVAALEPGTVFFENLKNTYYEYPSLFWIVVGTLFIDALGSTLLFPFFALYITQRFDVGMTQAGVLLGISSLFG